MRDFLFIIILAVLNTIVSAGNIFSPDIPVVYPKLAPVFSFMSNRIN